MGGYDTSALHHRQHEDTGNAVLASLHSRPRWRPMALPASLTVLGVLLSMVGPLPGLGVALLLAGLWGLAITAGIVLLGAFR